jgi:3',5'-cyclic AMP phosphodiesterase CpdA
MPTRAVIAHISDLHYGNHDAVVEGFLKTDLLNQSKPDFVVVTGDLSERQWPWQFKSAKGFLEGIVSGLSDANRSARVIVIPGNHDVFLRKGRGAWKKAFRDWDISGNKGVCRPATLEAFHKQGGNVDDAKAASLAKCDWSYCEYYPECQIAFLKFDSNKLAAPAWAWLLTLLIIPVIYGLFGPYALAVSVVALFVLVSSWIYRNYARGQVRPVQMQEMRNVLERYEKAFPPDTGEPAFVDARKIALVHHHVHYLPNLGSDSILLMVDAGPFWRTMIDFGVELILHGHKHYATHAVIRYMAQTENRGREERELLVLSAGTATSRDRPDGNSYYLLEADALSCRVRQRRTRDIRFEPDGAEIVFWRNFSINVPGSEDPIDGAALDAMLTPDKGDYVDNLDIEEMNYEGTIDKDLGYCMEITYAGKGLRSEPFLSVPMVVVNAPAREHTLDPVVTNLLANPCEIIEGVTVKLHPQNVRKLVIKIPLPTANPGEDFKIHLKVCTPAMMYDINDFDAIGLLRYRHGPKKFSYALRSERKFVGVQCFAVHRSGLRTLKLPAGTPQLIDGLYVVRPIIDSTNALGAGVLCHYHKLLPMPTAAAPADRPG